MAIVPLNVARVSQNLRAFQLQQTLTSKQLDLLRIQNQFSTGLKFQTPSEAPADASIAGTIDRRLDVLNGVNRNLRSANATLTATEAALNDAIDLMTQAHNAALEAVNSSTSAEERSSLANLIDSFVGQAVSIGNRKHINTYLFSGHYGEDVPFEQIGNGVLYRGDDKKLATIVDSDLSSDTFTVSGAEFFGAVSSQVRGRNDLQPGVTASTRISDLRGTSGNGVRLGKVLVSDGTTQTQIDLSTAATVGDIVDRLNAEMPNTLTASVTPQGIQVIPTSGVGTTVSISDIASGQTARDLGITATNALGVGSADLDPRLTLQTQISSLSNGTGIGLAGDIVIRNGTQTATIPMAGATTVEDVINKINGANVGVWAKLNEDGRTIDVLNRVSGTDLYIEDSGGSSALNLGIRSTHGSVALADLRDGRGVQTESGADFRITTASGTNIDVDIDGATTLQDVIDRINTAGACAITAGITSTGSGLFITDNTAGPNTLQIDRLNLSAAIDGLGLNVRATGNQLIGDAIRPVRVNSAFTSLLELRDSLRSDDTQGIQFAAQRLEGVMSGMLETQGKMAAQAKAMDDRTQRLVNEDTATRVLLSDVRDLDLTEAVVRFQQVQTALQANITASARIQSLSLLDALQ